MPYVTLMHRVSSGVPGGWPSTPHLRTGAPTLAAGTSAGAGAGHARAADAALRVEHFGGSSVAVIHAVCGADCSTLTTRGSGPWMISLPTSAAPSRMKTQAVQRQVGRSSHRAQWQHGEWGEEDAGRWQRGSEVVQTRKHNNIDREGKRIALTSRP